MPLNHTFSITMCNTKLIVKLALLIFILVLIALSIVSSVIMPTIKEITAIITATNVNPNDFVNHPIVTLRTEIIDKCLNYLKSTNWQATLGIFIAVYFCLRFFLTLPQLPVTKVLYKKMCSGYDAGLFNTFIEVGLQNVLLSFLLSVITSILNIGLWTGSIALLVVSARAKAYIALPFIIMLSIIAFSTKSALLSQWLPEICVSETKNIFKGIKVAVKNSLKQLRKNLLCYSTLNVLFVAVVSATLIPTLGAIPIICIPVFAVMRATLSLTLNFAFHHKKYFVNNGSTVYSPEKLF